MTKLVGYFQNFYRNAHKNRFISINVFLQTQEQDTDLF